VSSRHYSPALGGTGGVDWAFPANGEARIFKNILGISAIGIFWLSGPDYAYCDANIRFAVGQGFGLKRQEAVVVTIRKVLLVEDERILAENLKAYLENRHCEVHIAHDGTTAILLAVSLWPDILVLDYCLPDMDAFEILDALHGLYEGERLLMTAHPSGEICDGAARRGIVHILLKPFPLADLGRAVCKPQIARGVRGS